MDHTVSLDTVYAALCQLQAFLKPYIGLTNTHGAEFLSEDHWCRYVSPAVQSNLLELCNEDLVNLSLLTMSETSEKMSFKSSTDMEPGEAQSCTEQADEVVKVKNLGKFISQAQSCHLENLGVLTPLDSLLPERFLSKSTFSVISEAMCEKKIHEVGIMVDVVSALYKTTHSDLIVDVGSGKGYFASEMSLKHKIPVVGFDSRDTNTHGASQRDKKLAKKWAGLERRKGLEQPRPSSSQCLDEMQIAIGSKHNRNQSEILQQDTQQESTVLTPLSTATSKNSDTYNATDSSAKDFVLPKAIQASGTEQSETSQLPLQNKTSDCNLYNPVTLFVHPEMDLCKVIREEIPLYRTIECPRLFLSGLHTCGSLAVTTLNLFLQDPNTVALCCVGCCYQLMEEYWPDNQQSSEHQEQHFPISAYGKSLGLQLGRNARNLASQSVHRIRASGQLQGGDFYWRALLNVLLEELGIPIPERIVGMRGLNKKCKTFQDYAAAALKKLGVADKMPETHQLENLEARHKETHARMTTFFQLKLVLAPVIEALILLDRLAFLLEQNSISRAHLVQLFDPVLSPRCFALIAWKETSKKETHEPL